MSESTTVYVRRLRYGGVDETTVFLSPNPHFRLADTTSVCLFVFVRVFGFVPTPGQFYQVQIPTTTKKAARLSKGELTKLRAETER